MYCVARCDQYEEYKSFPKAAADETGDAQLNIKVVPSWRRLVCSGQEFRLPEQCLPCVCLIALSGRGVWFLTPVSWLLRSLARNSFFLYPCSQTVVAKVH